MLMVMNSRLSRLSPGSSSSFLLLAALLVFLSPLLHTTLVLSFLE
jgi:hypothetical protein